ncbi:peptidoglycan-binding protein [Chloroflexota bacterium]
MPSSKPEKARITNLDDRGERDIECLFNPNEYTFSKQNTWNKEKVIGKNVPQLAFGGGEAMTLTMQLFFDTYATGEDVRKTTNRIWKLMNINEKLTDMTSVKGRPPMVEFHWGSTWSFQAVITSISQKFTLFRYDGTPVRATLDVSFLQAKEKGKYPGQNPTTVGEPGYRRRVVMEGDTIDWIAHDEYGDSAMWRFIADTNNMDDPSRLRPGQILAIAPPP